MEMKFWQVYLWYTVIGHCVCAINVWEPVSVSPRAQLSVTRGGQVDLRRAILFTDQAATADCQVQFIARDHCGRVEPTRFGCSSYSGPILYQHFGCLSERELPTFLVSSRTEIAANVSTFSVEIIIEAARPPTSEITVELIEEAQSGSPLLQLEGTYNYRIVFPTALIGRCHYEVVTEWPHLSLPSSGTLIGVSHQPVPCGLMPTGGLTYIPRNISSPATEDHLLIKVHSHNKYAAARNQFVILPVNFEVEGNTSVVHEIPTQHLVVRQGANTPIPASLFAFPSSLTRSSQLHLGNSHHYTFPVLNAGSFQSILSSSTNVSYTTFTDRELLRGDIAFCPSFSAPLLMTYRYNVSNAAGVVVATGEVAVFVEAHDWDWPVQRTNQPMQVMEGGSSFFDHNIFDFYLQTDTCLQHAMMRVVVAPEHGRMTFLNGSSLGSDDRVLIGALKNGSVLVYHHTGGSEEMADSITWEVSCSDGPLLQVFTSILVAPIRDLPTVLSGGWDITVHRSWATPLSPSAVIAYDIDSPLDEVTIALSPSSEGLVRINWKKLRGRDITYLPSFVETKVLLDQNAAEEVTSFTLAELEAYRIWYLPPNDTSLDNEILTFSINNSTATIGVNISDADLRHSLFFSTFGEYPSLTNNLPLPLHTHLGTYITSSYLYSRALLYSSKKSKVTYIVHSPPTNGLLCLLSGEECQASITRFTQRDINSQKLFYKQNESTLETIEEDGFDFELTMDGFRQHSAVIYRFHFKPVPTPPVSVAMDRIFFVNAKRGKPIAARHFRPFSRYLDSKDITFHITRRPRYGYLKVNGIKHPDNFTFKNLLDRVLTYEHDPSATEACSDQFSFSVGNSTHTVEGTMDIAIRRGRDDIHVKVNIGQHTLYPGQRKFVFGSDDINVSSSFCPDQVTFSLNSPPSMGVLTLVDNKHNTVIQLEENSTFTANDIYSGFLHYTFTSQAPVVTQISDVFNLVARDPTSEWPKNTVRYGEGRITGHFNVTIIPMPNVEHSLVINITSPGFLSWLPSYGVYGYVFSEEDVVIYNSTIEPEQVVIQIDMSPMFGEIWRDNAFNNIFTVEDINNGLVRYQSKDRYDGISSDLFQMSIIVNLTSFMRIAARADFSVDWATVQLQNGTLRVGESAGEVEVVVRRTGALWFESQVLLSTRAESARTNPDCRSPADFCNTTRSLVFPVDSAEMRVIIPIIDDDIAEDTESFMVSLSNPSNAVINDNQNHTVVWITDTGDYSVITMLGDPGYSECSHVTRVEEWVGQANITLRRTGNLEQRVGVVCHTLPLSAFEFSDYIPRQQHPNSTVWFEVNQREANCSIEIVNDTSSEILERFYVQLGEDVRGRGVLGEPGALHCIEINNDREDWPKVNFTMTELVIRENETADVLVPIVFSRTGPDLSSEMPTVKLRSYIENGEDDAIFMVDFDLPADESCPEMNPEVSCVTFESNQTTAVLHVIIKRDTILEANESFHLIIISPFRHAPYGMKVTILESAPPAVIGFASPVTRLNESGNYETHLESVPIVRSGYLNSSVAVLCRVKGAPTFGNATPDADFITSPRPSKVTFNEGVTHGACLLLIKDDEEWEGPEILRVELELDPNESLGAEMSVNGSSTVVVIDDSEDTPTIEFKKNVYGATEPLSNFDIDRTVTTLTLVRDGDLSYTAAVRYVIDGDPASFQSPSDPSQEIVFHPHESTKELEIVLQANYEKNTVPHESLVIRLVEGWVHLLGNISVPARLGVFNKTVITITHRDYSGPFFPDLPVVANVGDSLVHTPLFYDLPLHCITPCSSLYLAERERLNIIWQGCAAQNITQETTVFSWEVSRDGINFTALEHATALTNTHSEILDTFYLKSGFYVRCLARAVSISGVRGHTRTSQAVFLGGKRYSCNGRGETVAELTSYSSFGGQSKDLLRLTVRVPHYNNTIPVLSSHPIHDKSDLEHSSSSSCSTLLPYDRSLSWMDNKPLYSHLDRERCVWEFSKWLPVEDWLEQCGARRQGEDHSATTSINITVYSAYIQFDYQLATHALTGDHSTDSAHIIISNPSNRAVFLPPPIHTLPENRDKLNGSAHIFPIAVEQSSKSESTIFQVYFSSLLPLMADRRTYAAAVANTSSDRPPVLLHTNTVGNTSKQIWLWEFVGATLPTTIPVVLYPTNDQTPLCEADCSGDDDAALQFPLAVASDGGDVYRPAFRATVTLQHKPDVVSNRTETFTLGEPVYIVFGLDPCLEIQPGFTFAVSELSLCQRREAASLPLPGGTCLNLLGTVTGVAMETGPFDVPLQRREHMVILQFNTLSIDVEQYSSQAEWYLELSYGIAANSHEMVVTERTVLNISLDLTRPTTTGALSTVGETPMPQSMQLLYAAVAILVVALIIMASGFTVIGTLVWTTKMRMQIKSKVRNELEARRMSVSASRKNSMALNNKRKEPDGGERGGEQGLRRAQSTIGFPTREKLKRARSRKSTTTTADRAEVGPDQPMSPCEAGARAVPRDEGASVQPSKLSPPLCAQGTVTRARSLPNLNILETRTSEGFFMGEPQPRKLRFQTTVSKVNTERWHLNKWAQHHIKANKQLETARTIHDIATRRRNYGANESKQNSSLNKGHNELARYAVRSLAASAKTPEPERGGPRTKL